MPVASRPLLSEEEAMAVATVWVLWGLAQEVDVDPDPNALPGGPQLQQIVNGIAAFSLVILVGAIIGGAVWWAVGAAQGNYQQISGGKRTVLIAVVGAVLIGGAAALVNFFTALGNEIS